jgi:hypothetical protein
MRDVDALGLLQPLCKDTAFLFILQIKSFKKQILGSF